MKWKNIDIGPAYYYITGTITEWLPLLTEADIRRAVCGDIDAATRECNGSLGAFVIMPDHLHLLVFLSETNMLHKFNKIWRGRSGRHIAKLVEKQSDSELLKILASHARSGCKYALWKEQVRALPIWSKDKLYSKIAYIHNNPIRRGLVEHPGDWEFSSWRFYERGEDVGLEMGELLI